MSKSTLLRPCLGAATILCWSGYNVAAKHGIDTGLSPELLAFLRFSVPGLVAIPLLTLRYTNGVPLGVSPFRLIVLVLLGGPVFGLVAVSGYVHGPLSHGLLFAPVAVFVTSSLLGAVLLKEQVTPRRLGGAAAMFFGLAVLIGLDLRSFGPTWMRGVGLFVLAGSMWGGYTVLLRHWRIPLLQGTLGIAAGSALLALPLLRHAAWSEMQAVDPISVFLQVVMQGIVGGIISVATLISAVRVLPVQQIALLPIFTPVVALGLDSIAFGTAPTLAECIGVAIIVVGFGVGLDISASKLWSRRHGTAHR